MSLTSAQKAAGRQFRDASLAELVALNAREPADGPALVFWRVYRHDCPAAGGASVGIDLHEHYQFSPEYRVCHCSRAGTVTLDFPHMDCGSNSVAAPEGFFGYVWKDGRCPDCGLAVRSEAGRLVVSADRPPAEVRVVGG